MFLRVRGPQTTELLGRFISEHEGRIVKRATKALRYELDEGISRLERKVAIPAYLGELGRLLLERGMEAPRLWGEMVRPYGRAGFEGRREISDLLREFKTLHFAIEDEWFRRHGTMDLRVMELLTDCMVEGQAAVAADYVRRLRNERIEFRESALIETILEHLDEGILLVEADGTLSYATKPAVAIVGSELENVIGKKVDEPGWQQVLDRLQARKLDGTPIRSNEVPAVRTLEGEEGVEPLLMRIPRRGGERIIEAGALPIWMEGTSPGERTLRGVIMTLRDRTEDIRKSTELRQAYKELTDLHARLLHRTRTQAMGELASGAAHALNNLLNAMTLRMHLLRESPSPEAIDSLNRSVNDIANLVARLQQFASPRPTGPVEATDLNEVLSEALAFVRPEARGTAEGAVHVHLELGEDLPPVRANASELREVLVNVMLQACDQLQDFGKLTVETSAEDEIVRCRIAWGAREIPQAEAAVWFEPFAGGAPPELSFALASARSAVARWDGELDARVTEQGQTEFIFELPASTPEHEAEEAPVARAGGQRSVLVIDDDADNASMLAEVLLSEGHFAVTATTGAEAIEEWKRRSYDVALIDLLMPDMSGVEIATELQKTRPEARLALVTGWELTGEEKQKAPVEAVFRKPVDLDRLLTFLEGAPQEHAGAAPH